MKKDLTKIFNDIKSNNQIFLNYLKAKFPLFHNSNFFFRDLEYGLTGFLEKKGIHITFREAYELAQQLTDYYEQQGVFKKINSQSWRLNIPEFVTTKPGDPFSF